MREQRGDGRDKRSDSCRDSNGSGQDVVRKQCCRGEQGCPRSEIETRHGVRAATGGIGGDGLQVGKVNDDQQGDDGRADRDDVADTQKTERGEEGEGGFRAVRGGAEGVEAEDGDAGGGGDLLRALVRGFQRLANDQVDKIHGLSMSVFYLVGDETESQSRRRGKDVRNERRDLVYGFAYFWVE